MPISRAHLKKNTRRCQRGAALITVLVAMMIITIMLFEFQYSAMVERKLAYNDLNQVQAYYLAKSGIRLGLLRVVLYGRVRNSGEIKSLKQVAGNIDQHLDKIWAIRFPQFPPKAESLKKLEGSDKASAEAALKKTRIKEGYSLHSIRSDSGKINLNALIVPDALRNQRINLTGAPQGPFHYPAVQLINLLESFLRDSPDPEAEYPDLRPEELVFDIMDWINPGNERFLGGNKDAYYEQQKPAYRAKRNRFYTVEELRMVRGVTDNLYRKLRPFVTTVGDGNKINLNTASPEMVQSLHRDITADDVKKIFEERDKNGGWATEDQFVRFVSQTLGRSSFVSAYPTPDQYPFTVAHQGFIIEALGVVPKSKSEVQKIIRVGVALTVGKGNSVDATITDPAKCKTAGKWWDSRFGKCKRIPSSNGECADEAGQWRAGNVPNQFCCYFTNNIPEPVCTGSGTAAATQQPNAAKILFWSET